MKLVSLRLITDDVARLADFYGRLTGGRVLRPHELFAEVITDVASIAIGHSSTVGLFGPGSATSADNNSLTIDFLVSDVDAEFERVREWVDTIVTEPKQMPWGNRSLILRDPDGTLVNLFTPVAPEAVARFARFD